jgi:hypothetical protein
MTDDDFDEAVRRFMAQADAPDAPYEPSAAERERAARQADLVRRLAEQEELDRRLAERDRRHARRVGGGARRAKWLAPVLVLALIGGAIWFTTDRGEEAIAGSPELVRPADWPSPPADVSPTPLGAPPPAPAEGPFEFVARQEGSDAPVAWDPCRPIHYVVNPAGQPAGAEPLIEDAVARVSEATGLQFRYDGTTDEVWTDDREPFQEDRYGDRWAPVLISWSSAATVPALADDTAGQGGPLYLGFQQDELVSVTGAVVLDAEQLTPAMTFPDGPTHVRAVIQHELGHVVGLDHVDDPAQLMHPETSGTTDWGPGDLRGLHALGTGECRPEL